MTTKKAESIEVAIEKKAAGNGHFAIAFAILKLGEALDDLRRGLADTLYTHGETLHEGAVKVSDSINDVAHALNTFSAEIGVYETEPPTDTFLGAVEKLEGSDEGSGES